MSEVICEDCRGTQQEVRECAICGATVCRDNARNAVIRVGGGEDQKVIACRDVFKCMVRHVDRIMK